MDVFAHTLWTNAVFHYKYHQQRKMRYLAAFFGVIPDLLGFTPLFVYLILSGRFFGEDRFPFADTSHWSFGFAEQAYNFTHSLVIFAVGFIIVHFALNFLLSSERRSAWQAKLSPNRDPSKIGWIVFWPMLGWALHILIDIPTHPDFYSTPFLFPLSGFKNHYGVSWGHPVFMAINYSMLVLVYFRIYYYQKRKFLKREE